MLNTAALMPRDTHKQAAFQCGSVPVFVNLLVRRVCHLIEFDDLGAKGEWERI